MLTYDAKTAEIFAYGDIGDGAISDLDFVDVLQQLNGRRVTVRINSGGGSADQGIAIYESLKRHRGGVDTIVDSLAASAASLVALAGQRRSISKGGRVMIHRAMTVAAGNTNDMSQVATILRAYDESIAAIYADYMPNTVAEILRMMDRETWYTAEQALAAGLVTSVPGVASPVAASSFRPATKIAKPTPKPAPAKAGAFPVARQAAALRSGLYSRV